ncbi:MAG: thioredoxin fold domain-containing protein [Myxococcales bacterium]|nr:thioredoxin fold domain-containing protein [Myxococcales bacterium]
MSDIVREIDAQSFTREVLEHRGPVAVDFYSTECAPCEALAPKFDGAAARYGADVKFVKIFRQGNRELADTLGVRASPTVLFFQDGHEVGQRLGGGISARRWSASSTRCSRRSASRRSTRRSSQSRPSATC